MHYKHASLSDNRVRRERDSFSPAGSVRIGSDLPPAGHSLPIQFESRQKNEPYKMYSSAFLRRERDSNPCGIAPKRFSRPPRYDRFDIPPCGNRCIIAQSRWKVNAKRQIQWKKRHKNRDFHEKQKNADFFLRNPLTNPKNGVYYWHKARASWKGIPGCSLFFQIHIQARQWRLSAVVFPPRYASLALFFDKQRSSTDENRIGLFRQPRI